MKQFSATIKKIGLDLGFDKIGITSAKQPTNSNFLEGWLTNGYAGTMDWMMTYKDKRMNIEKLYPGVRSVICVAHNYYYPIFHSQNKKTGKISRYACGEDYHRIMKKKLKMFLSEIKKHNSTVNGRLCVDTAPIMEKLWAEKAGLGWQGKNTNLITRDYGSWVFLGEILIDKELSYDAPIEDFCGSCQACLDACPTDALIEPYVLDAQRCISYLTIEYWDQPIPDHLQDKMDGWVFGCDICQDVCPWNKFSKTSQERRYKPREEKLEYDLLELDTLGDENYKSKFKKRPVLRPGWKNFQRNVKAVKKSTSINHD